MVWIIRHIYITCYGNISMKNKRRKKIKKRRNSILLKISLKLFSKKYLIYLYMEHNFKVNQMLRDVGINNHRLYAPLLAWCFLTDKKVSEDSLIYPELKHLRSIYSERREDDVYQYCKDSPNIELN